MYRPIVSFEEIFTSGAWPAEFIAAQLLDRKKKRALEDPAP